jgi:hypothetical protein
MRSHIISGLVGGLIIAAFMTAGIASGAVGDAIRAGQTTTYGGPTTNSTELEGSPAAPKPLLILDKNTNGPVLRLEPRPGQPALSVTNSVKIANLNADRLDGVDGAKFLQAYLTFEPSVFIPQDSVIPVSGECADPGDAAVGAGLGSSLFVGDGAGGPPYVENLVFEWPHVAGDARNDDPLSMWNSQLFILCVDLDGDGGTP